MTSFGHTLVESFNLKNWVEHCSTWWTHQIRIINQLLAFRQYRDAWAVIINWIQLWFHLRSIIHRGSKAYRPIIHHHMAGPAQQCYLQVVLSRAFSLVVLYPPLLTSSINLFLPHPLVPFHCVLKNSCQYSFKSAEKSL